MFDASLSSTTDITLRVKHLTKKYGSSINTRYLHDIEGFAADVLGVVLWDSEDGNSQLQIAKDVELSFSKQVERRDYELGEITEDELVYWKVGEPIKTVFNAQSGHGIGKTLVAAVISLWVYTHFLKSITYTFSPTKAQAVDLMWKEINTLHKQGNLTGKALETKIKDLENTDHFIEGRTVPRSKAGSTESVHGQHSEFFLAICDEAQAYQQSLFDGIESILGSGISVMILLSNPRYAHVPAQQYRLKERTKSYTISCFNHPNVVTNTQIIPGAVNRDYIYRMLEDCEIVDEHKKELNTFTLPWLGDKSPIYVPSNSFLWRVLGLPSSISTGDTFFNTTMVEDAINKDIVLHDPPHIARIGVDVARFGQDSGVVYYRRNGAVMYYSTLSKADGNVYVDVLTKLLNELHEDHVTDVQVRLDSTGGYASTIEDTLNKTNIWNKKFDYFEIVPTSYGSNAYNGLDYYNTVTELYGATSQAFLKGLRYRGFVPESLLTELVGRTFTYIRVSSSVLQNMRISDARKRQLLGTEVKLLSKKEEFRNTYGFSPDYSDALCLAAAPDWVFINHLIKSKQVNPVVRLQQRQHTKKRLIAWRQ